MEHVLMYLLDRVILLLIQTDVDDDKQIEYLKVLSYRVKLLKEDRLSIPDFQS